VKAAGSNNAVGLVNNAVAKAVRTRADGCLLNASIQKQRFARAILFFFTLLPSLLKYSPRY